MTESPALNPKPRRSRVAIICAALAGLIGFVFALYYGITLAASDVGTGLFVSAVGLLSVIGAYGYWLEKRWGVYVHFVSVLGQAVFPGSLFPMRPDLYYLFAFFVPLISISVLARMTLYFKKKKQQAALLAPDNDQPR